MGSQKGETVCRDRGLYNWLFLCVFSLVDIDECKISGSCFRVGCINFPGSFKCDCGITGLFYDPQDRNCKGIVTIANELLQSKY